MIWAVLGRIERYSNIIMDVEQKKAIAREKSRIWRLNNPNGWDNYYNKNKTKILDTAKVRYQANSDKYRLKTRTYYSAHRQEILDKSKSKYIPITRISKDKEIKRLEAIKRTTQWQKKYPDKVNEKNKKWANNNKPKINAFQAAFRFQGKINKSKNYKKQILEFYEKARIETIKTGITHEVDHIIPLSNKTVSGLHVPWNLRIVTRSENRRKANKIILDLL